MTEAERDELIEQGVSAHRARDAEGRPVPPPAWFDLSPEDMDEVVRRQFQQRAMERAIAGYSGTVRAVLVRI